MHSYAPITMRSHKPRESKTNRDKPVDAADLTRRLTAHLDSQESAQRRASRADRPLSTSAPAPEHPPKNEQPQAYHHVPVLAASSFARTATADPHRIVHRLSAPILREHLAQAEDADAGFAGSVQRAQTVDRARRDRQMRSERNAWQWGRGMEAVREGDVRRGVYQLPRRTFAGDDIEVEGMDLVEVEAVGMGRMAPGSGRGFEGRGDWAQSEEERLRKEKGRRGMREIVRVLGLGKRESVWTLKGRRKSAKGQEVGVGNEDEAVVTLEKFTTVETEGKRSRRASFLARLKWHPSHST